jgi:hypothetical protein
MKKKEADKPLDKAADAVEKVLVEAKAKKFEDLNEKEKEEVWLRWGVERAELTERFHKRLDAFQAKIRGEIDLWIKTELDDIDQVHPNSFGQAKLNAMSWVVKGLKDIRETLKLASEDSDICDMPDIGDEDE